ncbi:tyrosine-type recombinase/integrase [Fontivita pretiosa]|uniref:tyrosine-type recombinase/integrase n=1 Tax=Fontivita pretiosa TaxID=2989684 RepID=UPI003D16FB94
MEEKFIDIRNTNRAYELALARLKSDTHISQRNKDLILRFVRDAALGKTVIGRAKKKIGVARLLGYITQIRPLIEFTHKDLDQITQADMEAFVEALENDTIKSRAQRRIGETLCRVDAPLSPRYKIDIKLTVKKFYKWLWGESRSYPKLVEWIDTYMESKEISALTEAEVNRMLDRANTPQHRALIQVLFDGGVRIGELLNVRLRHVSQRSFEEHAEEKCFVVRVPFSKTLRRTVALPMPATTKWLTLWLEDHPAQPKLRPDGTIDAADTSVQLFPMSDNAVRLVLRRVGQRALGKRVYPHLLRHTSATYWSNTLPHFKFCKRFGWTMTSNMPQRYIDREGVDEVDVARIYRERQQKRPRRGFAVSMAEDPESRVNSASGGTRHARTVR